VDNKDKPLELRFKFFLASSMGLLASLSGLTMAEFYLEPSFEQELIGFIALSIGAFSGFCCILAYLSILWYRLKGFFKSERR
jgi:hypothetical protein